MKENSFSWERMALLARYYMPAIKKQLLIYLVLLVVYVFCGIGTELSGWFSSIFIIAGGMMQVCFSYLFYLAPVGFSRYDDETLGTLLPVKGSEKALFIIGYSLVVVPLFIVAVTAALVGIVELISGINPLYWIKFFQHNFTGQELVYDKITGATVVLNSIVSIFSMTAIVLYVVTVSRKNKLLKGILTTFIVNIASVVVGLIYGIVTVAKFGKDLVAGNTSAELISEDEVMTDFFLNHLLSVIFTYEGVLMIVAIVCIVLTWRKICHRQV